MSEELLIRYCSPTLAGLKTGSLFTCRYDTAAALRDSIRTFNRRLAHKGLRVLPLRVRGQSALVYVYRPRQLEADLSREETADILNRYGYLPAKPDRCVSQLIRRLQGQEEFPHEIGLFLGYPPEDVWGFIQNNAQQFKTVGCWKVYGDVEQAERLFASYKSCTASYMRQHQNGNTIERLTVAV